MSEIKGYHAHVYYSADTRAIAEGSAREDRA